MKLYSRVNIPTGINNVGYLDKKGRAVKICTLFPDRPTEVPDEAAEKILEQNPHIASKTLCDFTKKNATEVEAKKPDPDEREEKMLAVITTISEQADLTEVSANIIHEWGLVLGVTIPKTWPKAKQVKTLEDRCNEILDTIEGAA